MPASKSLSRGVAMVGAGMSKFGAFAEKNTRDLFVEAYKAMKKTVDKGFDPSVIEALYIGNFSSDQFEHQAHIAPLLTDAIGLSYVERNAVRAGLTDRAENWLGARSGTGFSRSPNRRCSLPGPFRTRQLGSNGSTNR